MEHQRHFALGTLLCLMLCSYAFAEHEGAPESTLQRLRGLLASLNSRHVPDDIVLETADRQLLGPLWTTTDPDIILPTHSGLRRSLQYAAGDEMEKSADPDPDPQPNSQRPKLRNEDFVYVAPTNFARLPLAQASRYWRKGMRAVFVVDQPADQLPEEVEAGAARYRETFAWYPNFRRMADDQRDHYLEGDRRGAMAPILAYASLKEPASMTPWTNPSATVGVPRASSNPSRPSQRSQAAFAAGPNEDPFKWMLAGDDDTIFFMRGVKALLRDYDPQLPYFITDSMYIGSKSPQPGVWEMRCYPCHLQWGKWRRAARRLLADPAGKANDEIKAAPFALQGCGCSPENLCKKRFPGNESLCQHEWEGPVPFGGVGFIFSIGFFKQLAAAQGGKGLRAYETCINAPNTSVTSFPLGSDAFMSRCLWRLGFPITDPGYTPFGRYMGEVLNAKHFYEAPFNLTQGQLPQDALARWSVAVSLHLGARQHKSFRSASMTVKYIIGVYDLVAELLWPSVPK